MGSDGKIFNVKKSSYSNVKSCVSANQELSDYFVTYTGVKKGETLSFLLFSLFVNDTEKYLVEKNCSYKKFDEMWLDKLLICIQMTQSL